MARHRNMAKCACISPLVSNPGKGIEDDDDGNDNDDDDGDNDDDTDDKMLATEGPSRSSLAVVVTEEIWARKEENVAVH